MPRLDKYNAELNLLVWTILLVLAVALGGAR
jgi:hypothetical protein